MPPTAAAEAWSSTSANDVIANPFSFSGFSDELLGEIDLDDIDVGKTTGTDNIDDDAFFEDFAIDSDGEGEEASGVAAPAAASSLTASPPPPVQSTQSSPQQQQQKQRTCMPMVVLHV